MTFELRYLMTGSLFSLLVHPAALRSAEASLSSKACSYLMSGSPLISRMRPAQRSVVISPIWMAVQGMDWTRSISVMPGWIGRDALG